MNRINLPKCYVLNSLSQINSAFRIISEVFKIATNIIQGLGLVVPKASWYLWDLGLKPLVLYIYIYTYIYLLSNIALIHQGCNNMGMWDKGTTYTQGNSVA